MSHSLPQSPGHLTQVVFWGVRRKPQWLTLPHPHPHAPQPFRLGVSRSLCSQVCALSCAPGSCPTTSPGLAPASAFPEGFFSRSELIFLSLSLLSFILLPLFHIGLFGTLEAAWSFRSRCLSVLWLNAYLFPSCWLSHQPHWVLSPPWASQDQK